MSWSVPSSENSVGDNIFGDILFFLKLVELERLCYEWILVKLFSIDRSWNDACFWYFLLYVV